MHPSKNPSYTYPYSDPNLSTSTHPCNIHFTMLYFIVITRHTSRAYHVYKTLHIFSISCFSIFCSQSLEFTTCQHPRILVTSYFQTSSKDILLSVSLPHFSCPRCLEYLCPRALILLRLWRYINHVLTYLFT